MHTPAIAVVIPVYNAGRSINESIESARAQTTSQWECMIVDDRSTDETPGWLAAYCDPRIRWIRRDNIGDCAARARGVSLARVPKIVCLDADDRLYPDALARCVSFLDKHPQGDVLESILRARFSPHPPRLVYAERWCPPAEWLGDRNPSGDWLLLAGAAINHKFAFIGRAPLVKYRVRRSRVMRNIANEYEETIRTGSCLRKAGALELKEVHS